MIYDALENWVVYFAEQYSELKAPPTDFSKRRQWIRPGLSGLVENDLVQIKAKDQKDGEGLSNRDEL